MDICIRRTLFAGALLFGGLLIALLLLINTPRKADPEPGPRQTFAAHLTALDERDWELANSYITERCQIDPEGMDAAVGDLEDNGYSFARAFRVEEVWFHDNGVKALLGLALPPGLLVPRAATMELVDGEWLISCN